MRSKRVIIIGIDGGTWKVLDEAIERGYMPFLAHCQAQGQKRTLLSTVPANTAASWSAFQTGLSPEATGIYDFQRWHRDTQSTELVNSTHLPSTVWEVVSASERRVGAVNVPLTYPPYKVNGFMLSGFLTPTLGAIWACPETLKHEILSALPEYQLPDRDLIHELRPHRDFDAFLSYMADLVESPSAASEYLLKRYDLDLFMVHFHATDFVQHCAWHYLDSAHPLYDADKNEQIMKRFYSLLDAAMRRVVEAFDGASNIPFSTFFVSDHGFETHRYRFHLGRWLVQNGYALDQDKSLSHRLMRASLRVVHGIDAFKLRRRVLTRQTRDRIGGVAFPPEKQGISWERSLAYARGASNEGLLYLNVSHKRFSKRVPQLLEEIREVTNPATGEEVVMALRETGVGSEKPWCPDVIVQPDTGYSIRGGYKPGGALFERVDPLTEYQAGKHAREGIFIALDAAQRVGQNLEVPDVFRIVLAELGVSPGKGNAPRPRARGYSEEDEARVRSKLKELGYC